MATKRIYVVSENGTGGERLVDAGTPAQAVRHAARKRYSATVADQRAIVRLMALGIEVEEAGVDIDEPDA